METKQLEFLKKRDLSNFINIRSAYPGDDLVLGNLLVQTFAQTYALKLPTAVTTNERERELRDVNGRRKNGIVRVIEFGFRIIGTYSLIYPKTELDESWAADGCTLRCLAVDPEFHSLKLSEHLLQDSVEVALGWGARVICLHVQRGAIGVARLYERFGFKRSVEGDRIYMGNFIEGYIFHINEKVS